MEREPSQAAGPERGRQPEEEDELEGFRRKRAGRSLLSLLTREGRPERDVDARGDLRERLAQLFVSREASASSLEATEGSAAEGGMLARLRGWRERIVSSFGSEDLARPGMPEPQPTLGTIMREALEEAGESLESLAEEPELSRLLEAVDDGIAHQESVSAGADAAPEAPPLPAAPARTARAATGSTPPAVPPGGPGPLPLAPDGASFAPETPAPPSVEAIGRLPSRERKPRPYFLYGLLVGAAIEHIRHGRREKGAAHEADRRIGRLKEEIADKARRIGDLENTRALRDYVIERDASRPEPEERPEAERHKEQLVRRAEAVMSVGIVAVGAGEIRERYQRHAERAGEEQAGLFTQERREAVEGVRTRRPAAAGAERAEVRTGTGRQEERQTPGRTAERQETGDSDRMEVMQREAADTGGLGGAGAAAGAADAVRQAPDGTRKVRRPADATPIGRPSGELPPGEPRGSRPPLAIVALAAVFAVLLAAFLLA